MWWGQDSQPVHQPPNSISLPLSGVSKISVTESQPNGAVGFQIPCAFFVAHDGPCNYQQTWYTYDCLSSFWSKHHVLTLNVGDAGACAFAFRPTRGPTLEWLVVESSVTNKEPTITLLEKLKLLFDDLLFNRVSRRVWQQREGSAWTCQRGFSSAALTQRRGYKACWGQIPQLSMKESLGGMQTDLWQTSWQLSQESLLGEKAVHTNTTLLSWKSSQAL